MKFLRFIKAVLLASAFLGQCFVNVFASDGADGLALSVPTARVDPSFSTLYLASSVAPISPVLQELQDRVVGIYDAFAAREEDLFHFSKSIQESLARREDIAAINPFFRAVKPKERVSLFKMWEVTATHNMEAFALDLFYAKKVASTPGEVTRFFEHVLLCRLERFKNRYAKQAARAEAFSTQPQHAQYYSAFGQYIVELAVDRLFFHNLVLKTLYPHIVVEELSAEGSNALAIDGDLKKFLAGLPTDSMDPDTQALKVVPRTLPLSSLSRLEKIRLEAALKQEAKEAKAKESANVTAAVSATQVKKDREAEKRSLKKKRQRKKQKAANASASASSDASLRDAEKEVVKEAPRPVSQGAKVLDDVADDVAGDVAGDVEEGEEDLVAGIPHSDTPPPLNDTSSKDEADYSTTPLETAPLSLTVPLAPVAFLAPTASVASIGSSPISLGREAGEIVLRGKMYRLFERFWVERSTGAGLDFDREFAPLFNHLGGHIEVSGRNHRTLYFGNFTPEGTWRPHPCPTLGYRSMLLLREVFRKWGLTLDKL